LSNWDLILSRISLCSLDLTQPRHSKKDSNPVASVAAATYRIIALIAIHQPTDL
jgi:hypothetical protein